MVGTLLYAESDQVVRSGFAVARATGGRVHLVHAIDRIINPKGGLDYEELAGAEGQMRGEDFQRRLGISDSESPKSEARFGAPHRVLVETAQELGADLIVIGATRTATPVAGLLGSTADRVLRKASCPVLVARCELLLPPRRVLAPVDLSPASGGALRCGLDLLAQIAQPGEIEIRALYVEEDPESALEQERKAEELRRFVLEHASSSPFEVETAVRSGEARSGILQELNDHPADFVMLGTHGQSGLDRWILGRVASAIAEKAPCSVLMISPDAVLAQGIAEAVAEDRVA